MQKDPLCCNGYYKKNESLHYSIVYLIVHNPLLPPLSLLWCETAGMQCWSLKNRKWYDLDIHVTLSYKVFSRLSIKCMPLPYIAQAIEEKNHWVWIKLYYLCFPRKELPYKCIITTHMMLNVSKSLYKSMQSQITKVTHQDARCNFKEGNEI